MKTSTKWVVYGAVPAVLSLVLQGMYFSGNLVLQRIACPKLPPLSLNAYREFGLVENVQNLLLLAIIGIFVAGARRAHLPRLRAAFSVLALFSVWVLLEEIDYGTHFYAYATAEEVGGWFLPAASPEFQALLAQTDFSAEPFNVHNQGDLTDIIKAGVAAVMFVLFVVAPFFAGHLRNPWLRYIVPDRFIVVTVAVMVLMRGLTYYLGEEDAAIVQAAQAAGDATREAGAMDKNLSEFREVLTYYIFLLYTGMLVFARRAPEPALDGDAPQDRA